MRVLFVVVFLVATCLAAALSSGARHQLQEDFTNLLTQRQLKQSLKQLPANFQNDIDFILSRCSAQDLFRDMEDQHMSAMNRLVEILRAEKDSQKMLQLAAFIRDYPEMNRALWLKAVLLVSNRREELMRLGKPNPMSLVVNQLLSKENYQVAQKQGKVPAKQRGCIPLDGSYTSVDNGVEHALWYFREDLLANYEHFYWHAFYPFNATLIPPNQNRLGELFYYYHHNMMIRYNVERLSVGFDRVKPIVVQEGYKVEEFYYPHLADIGGTKDQWGYRLPNSTFKNITMWVDIVDVIYSDIDNGALVAANGTLLPLTDFEGIDLLALANMGSTLCPNVERYDIYSIHSQGHYWISQLSIKGWGIMNNLLTVLRDPVFYRWHYWMDGMFQRHKALLTPYNVTGGDFQLSWPGVAVTQVGVKSDLSPTINQLTTFFNHVNVSVPYTPDFGPTVDGEPINYCIKRLEHEPFTFEISVERAANVLTEDATVRIFMAPRLNETGGRFSYEEQRQLMFSMDEFKVKLVVGLNRITRKSTESNLALQWKLDDDSTIPPNDEVPHCGCGWPQHLLIPRGNTAGMEFDVFVMVTDGEVDAVEEPQSGTAQEPGDVCTASHILCGRWNRPYPDARPMGYPFDRRGSNVANLDEFIDNIGNMKAVQITIIHKE